MDLELDERERLLVERTREICASIGPGEPAAETFPQARWEHLCQTGILGEVLLGAAPDASRPGEEGAGSLLGAVLVVEQLAQAAPDLVSPFVVNFASGWLVRGAGDARQRAEILPALAAGAATLAFALTEPGAGSDAAGITTQARREGDTYRVNGTKLFTTGAAEAERLVTVVRTDPEGPAHRGTSLLLVPRGASGLRIEPLRKIAGNHHASCRVELEETPVLVSDRLGPEHGGWAHLRETGGVERLLMAAASVGAGSAIVAEAAAFALERQQFTRPIASFQAIQHRLADMATELEAMRWLTYRAAFVADRTGPGAAVEVCMAKLFATERLQAIALDGMRVLGGRAYLADSTLAHRQREALLGLYAGGTNEIQRNLVARWLLIQAKGAALA